MSETPNFQALLQSVPDSKSVQRLVTTLIAGKSLALASYAELREWVVLNMDDDGEAFLLKLHEGVDHVVSDLSSQGWSPEVATSCVKTLEQGGWIPPNSTTSQVIHEVLKGLHTAASARLGRPPGSDELSMVPLPDAVRDLHPGLKKGSHRRVPLVFLGPIDNLSTVFGHVAKTLDDEGQFTLHLSCDAHEDVIEGVHVTVAAKNWLDVAKNRDSIRSRLSRYVDKLGKGRVDALVVDSLDAARSTGSGDRATRIEQAFTRLNRFCLRSMCGLIVGVEDEGVTPYPFLQGKAFVIPAQNTRQLFQESADGTEPSKDVSGSAAPFATVLGDFGGADGPEASEAVDGSGEDLEVEDGQDSATGGRGEAAPAGEPDLSPGGPA